MGSFGDWRKYRRLPDEWRDIVFYSESGQDWHHLEPLVVEQKAIEWLVEQGKAKAKKVTFKDYMNPPSS